MTLKNSRASLLCYFKLCASFHSHWWIQTGVTAQKPPIWVKIDYFCSHVTFKFDGWSYSPETAKWGHDLCDLDRWPWPFAWTSLISFVITPDNFVMIRWWEHSQKGVTDRRTDWTIHRAAWSQLKTTSSMLLQAFCIILWPLANSNWSYSPETPNLGQIRRFLEPCDLEIWRMILQNNRAPLLCYFKLFASFRSHWWIQTGVTVRKRPIWVKVDGFF